MTKQSKKKYPKHYNANSGEWVPHTNKMQWQCCDCGLVHNVYFKLVSAKDGKTDIFYEGLLFAKMTRNLKETNKVRKLK